MKLTRTSRLYLYYYSTAITFILSISGLYLNLSARQSPAGSFALLPLSLYFLYRSFKQTRSNQLYLLNHPGQPVLKHYSITLTIALYIIALGLTLLRGYTQLVLASGPTP